MIGLLYRWTGQGLLKMSPTQTKEHKSDDVGGRRRREGDHGFEPPFIPSWTNYQARLADSLRSCRSSNRKNKATSVNSVRLGGLRVLMLQELVVADNPLHGSLHFCHLMLKVSISSVGKLISIVNWFLFIFKQVIQKSSFVNISVCILMIPALQSQSCMLECGDVERN